MPRVCGCRGILVARYEWRVGSGGSSPLRRGFLRGSGTRSGDAGDRGSEEAKASSGRVSVAHRMSWRAGWVRPLSSVQAMAAAAAAARSALGGGTGEIQPAQARQSPGVHGIKAVRVRELREGRVEGRVH